MTGPRHTLLTLCLLGLATLLSEAAGGEPYISPERIDGVSTVDAEGLIELATEMPGLVIIDARIRADRKYGYIEGSLSLPDNETDCAALAAHVPDLDNPVLFYCNGVRCARSGHAARIARACGYTRIYWFRTGVEEWRRQQYPLVN
jgi:rhodanese-related sulfurtransferase